MKANTNMVLSVTLIEGADVPKADLIGKSDPYCVLTIKSTGESYTSKYINNTHTPTWNDSFSFFIKDLNQVLHIDLYDKDIYPKSDDLLAQIDIQLSTLKPGTKKEGWYNLTCVKGYSGTPKLHLDMIIIDGKSKF